MHRSVCCYLSPLQVLQSATLARLKKKTKKMKREAVEHLRCATTRWEPIWSNLGKPPPQKWEHGAHGAQRLVIFLIKGTSVCFAGAEYKSSGGK